MDALTLAALGGTLALDETSFGQFMVSRPLVVGVLVGWVLGFPSTGFTVGAVLELFYLAHFHVGGARFPESAPATITAVAAAAAHPGAGGLALGLIAGLVAGEIGGRSIVALRHLNSRIVPDPTAGPVWEGQVWRAHLGALVLDFLRGAGVTLVGVLIAPALVGWLGPYWPLDTTVTTWMLLAIASVPLGILWRSLSGARYRRALFAAGLVLGFVGGAVL